MKIAHRSPWLIVDLGEVMQVLSWAPHRGGLVSCRRVVWREVRDADLTPDLDVPSWLADELQAADLGDAVGLLTSRGLVHHHRSDATIGSASVACVATVGLGNAERVGRRVDAGPTNVGTINVLATVRPGLSETALVEAVAIAAEAKTAAIVDACRALPTGLATGTGTDCIVIAAPKDDTSYAGKHTDIGEALGGAVYRAVSDGASEWISQNT